MRKIIYFITVVSLFTLCSSITYSQSFLTYSPYSRFGIGELAPQGFAYTRSMGGISQGIRTGPQVNFSNPASYTIQDTLSFIFDFGLEANGVNYQQGDNSNFQNNANIHHLAIQFPVTKWWGASLGLMPYSNVGYRIRYTQMDPIILSSIGAVKHYHHGEGGISQLYIGNAFEPFKNFSVGANISYLFGSIEHHTDVFFPSGTNYYDIYTTNSLVIRDLVYSFGAQYSIFLGSQKQVRIVLGGTMSNETSVKGTSTTLNISSFGNETDTVSYSENPDFSFILPATYSGGFTLAYKNKFMGGAEYSTQDWSNTTLTGSPSALTKSQTLRVGFEITPNRFDLRSYMKRVSYRAGVRYTESYINLRDNQINDMAMTLGLGFPFRRTNSSFNLSIELGQRGTLNDNLIRETYGTFNAGVTFYDIWFIKRKYN